LEVRAAPFALRRNSRKTECDAISSQSGLEVRATPFALRRNSRKTECGAIALRGLLRLGWAALVLCGLLTVAMLAQRAMTVAEVVTFIKSQIKANGDDRATGDYLHKIKLTQRLDASTIEDLQGQGAGPKTVAALKALAAESAGLPAPPPVAAVAQLPPPKPPSAKEQAEVLDAMREYALSYTKGLPNYVCVQTTHRKQEPTEMLYQKGYRGYSSTGDVVQELLTFFDQKETYRVEMIDGKSVTNVKHEALGGVRSSGEFGSMLRDIFDPESGAEFAWDNWHTLRGKRVYAFAYHVDKDHGYSMGDDESHRTYTSAYKGLVYWDRDAYAIPKVTLDTVGIPADFPIHEVHIQLDYDLIKVGEREYMLPYHFLLTSRANEANSSNEADYRLYRKYGAEATITFGDTDPVPDEKLKDEPDKK
jgi:hypothetical protein